MARLRATGLSLRAISPALTSQRVLVRNGRPLFEKL